MDGVLENQKLMERRIDDTVAKIQKKLSSL